MSLTGRGVKVNVPLSKILIPYRPHGMIADQLAPVVPVNKQGDAYHVWNLADAYRTQDDKIGPGGKSQRMVRDLSSDTYFCQKYGLHEMG